MHYECEGGPGDGSGVWGGAPRKDHGGNDSGCGQNIPQALIQRATVHNNMEGVRQFDSRQGQVCGHWEDGSQQSLGPGRNAGEG